MAKGIRNSAKALIIEDGRLLAVKVKEADNRTYYVLPGGWQREDESLPDALSREVVDELGLFVIPEELVFLYESVRGDLYRCVEFVFVCEYIGDMGQMEQHCGELIEGKWLDIETLLEQPLYPAALRGQIMRFHSGGSYTTYLDFKGTADERYRDNIEI